MNERLADQDIQTALIASTGGADLDTLGLAMREAGQALYKQATALRKIRYRTRRVKARCTTCKAVTEMIVRRPDVAEIARAMAHTGKVIDDTTRLTSFLKGQPDSRPDTGNAWLRALTDAQLAQVQGWVRENTAR